MSIAKRVVVICGFSETKGFIDPLTEAIIESGLVEDGVEESELQSKSLKTVDIFRDSSALKTLLSDGETLLVTHSAGIMPVSERLNHVVSLNGPEPTGIVGLGIGGIKIGTDFDPLREKHVEMVSPVHPVKEVLRAPYINAKKIILDIGKFSTAKKMMDMIDSSQIKGKAIYYATAGDEFGFYRENLFADLPRLGSFCKFNALQTQALEGPKFVQPYRSLDEKATHNHALFNPQFTAGWIKEAFADIL